MSASYRYMSFSDIVSAFAFHGVAFCLVGDFPMQGYKKIAEMSEKWGISERRINTLCLEGRIEGAEKFGNVWAIPENAEKPKDDRIKSGKYKKWGGRET